MKKKFYLISVLFTFCASIYVVYAVSNSFSIDSSKLSFSANSKKNNVKREFNDKYNLTYNITSSNDEVKDEISNLSKKITYLLLGQAGNKDETAKEYYQRRHDYLDFRYNPEIPKNPNSFTGLDESSQEYKDDIVSGISVPGMFNILDELNITYNQISSIRVFVTDNMVISMVYLPNISIREEDKENPMEYNTVRTNFILYYCFKKINNEYKLYYLFGEKNTDLNEYFDDVENNEMERAFSISKNYNSQMNSIYDFSKLDALNETQINQVYNSNLDNIVLLNSFYNNELVASANGFLISDGIVVTTWDFLEKSLKNSQFFVVKSGDGSFYEIDGIVTTNPETDIAVIKLKSKISSSIVLGDIKKMNIEDPVITISSKTGVGLSLQTGIIVSNDGYIQSLLPLNEQDEGSPLFNQTGEVIGMNTSKSINSSISIAIDSKGLEEIKNKFSSLPFESIETISFSELKEKYYYTHISSESNVNSIPISKWNKYKKIGNIEKNIKLNLVKSSYDNNVVSLRYYNGISDYISGMQLAIPFKEELINSGFKQTLNSSKKCIYESNDFKVIIMDEFDYLIIVMVKL